MDGLNELVLNGSCERMRRIRWNCKEGLKEREREVMIFETRGLNQWERRERLDLTCRQDLGAPLNYTPRQLSIQCSSGNRILAYCKEMDEGERERGEESLNIKHDTEQSSRVGSSSTNFLQDSCHNFFSFFSRSFIRLSSSIWRSSLHLGNHYPHQLSSSLPQYPSQVSWWESCRNILSSRNLHGLGLIIIRFSSLNLSVQHWLI